MRQLFAGIEIKVSEPFVSISETVGEASAVGCFSESPNRKNIISMTTEPLEKGISERIQQEQLYKKEHRSLLANVLINDFNWDELSASSIWAFGPVSTNSNILLDYTLEDEIDKVRLNATRNSIV